jgi:Penicillin binding protein transpeptidase domain
MQGFTCVVTSAHPEGTGYTTFVGNGWNQAAFPLAGKTGTASLIGSNGLAEEPVSWFVGFGPNPGAQYVVVCEINQGGYGADAAAPVVRNIFNYLAAHPVGAAAIPPAESTIHSLTPVTLPPASSPTNATTTTTTAPKAGTTTPTTTTPSTGSTTPTTAPGGATAGG